MATDPTGSAQGSERSVKSHAGTDEGTDEGKDEGRKLDNPAIAEAARALAAGELVAFPTETVYGLGARADDTQAVARIFSAKGRPADHPLIVHVASMAAAESFAASLSVEARCLMQSCWPGPVTVIVPRRSGMARAAAAGQASIGLRMPAHPVALALLRQAADLGVAGVAAPSANRFGRVSPTTAEHVRQEFGQTLRVLEGGGSEIGIESAIVDCTQSSPALLRPGQLSAAHLARLLGKPLALPSADSPRASGTLASHYAPDAPVVLWTAAALWDALQAGPGRAPAGLAVYSRSLDGAALARLGQGRLVLRRMPDNADQAAHELFGVLRELDAAGVSSIWIELPPPHPEWDGVRDRLTRAAA